MKWIIACVSLLTVLLILSSIAVGTNLSPEKLIIGKWKEVSWEYEKVTNDSKDQLETNEEYRDEIYENLVIHKAEIWEFDDKGNLLLHGKNKCENLLWSVKGRGHILELKHNNNKREDYQIEEVNKNKLVLYFYFDLQIRGIVKITFKRIN